MKKRQQKWRFLGVVGFVLMTLILSGCGEPFLSTLQPAGEVAQKQFDLMMLATIIMVLVIVVVTVIFLIVVFKYRRKDNDKKIPKQVEGSHKLEVIWTVIPIILLIILAVPTVSYTFQLADVSPMDNKDEDGKTKDALVVNVRANAYWWEFEYPDAGVVTSQELVVPTDERVYFNLTASDVKHSFWVPAAGGKIDTNTDNINSFFLEFNADKADEADNLFYGKCAELCGPSHALMDFKVVTKSKEDFDQWLEGMQKAEKPVAEGATAQQGEEIFNKSCIGCHAVTPNENMPVAARTGPNLTTFGERSYVAGVLENNKENTKEWIKNSQEIKPGNKMPSFNDLGEEELDALAEYLHQLKASGE